jgi:hypothetical protein
MLIASGCDLYAPPATVSDNSAALHPSAQIDDHAHASEGPHHGTLIELGNEEYHAELIHDETTVTVFLLDSSAAKISPIDANELTINLISAGKPAQFKLAASPDVGDAVGTSSRFALPSPELVEHLEHDHAGARLIVLINGKSYRGNIQHDHEHDHEHGHIH